MHDSQFGGRILHMLCPLAFSAYKEFFKIPLFSSSSVFLMVLNPSSGVHNSNVKNLPMSYIKCCLKSQKYCRKHEISQVFETLSQTLLREDHKWSSYPQCTCQDATFYVWQGGIIHILIFISRRWIEDYQEDRTGGKRWNFEKSFINTS